MTYGIHITHRFLEDLDRTKDPDTAVQTSLNHTGSALFGAATTTMSGFGLLVFSLLPPMKQFGIIIALTIFYAFVASIFVLPTLLVLWAKCSQKDGSCLPEKDRPEDAEDDGQVPEDRVEEKGGEPLEKRTEKH